MQPIKSILLPPIKFILALVLGCTFAALVSFTLLSPEGLTLLMVIGGAGTFLIFGLGPAVIFGLPALWLLQRLHVTPLTAALSMTIGGAAIGTLVTFAMFNRFVPLGPIGGGSIGVMQGFLLYRPKPARVVPQAR
jgi:hypothetical protein